MTMRMYANRKKLALNNVEITLQHNRIHAQDCDDCENAEGFIDHDEKIVKLDGELSDEEKQRLLEIADRCPVHETLHNEIKIDTKLE